MTALPDGEDRILGGLRARPRMQPQPERVAGRPGGLEVEGAEFGLEVAARHLVHRGIRRGEREDRDLEGGRVRGGGSRGGQAGQAQKQQHEPHATTVPERQATLARRSGGWAATRQKMPLRALMSGGFVRPAPGRRAPLFCVLSVTRDENARRVNPRSKSGPIHCRHA